MKPSTANRRGDEVTQSPRARLSLVPQPTLLLAGVVACDALQYFGAGQSWTSFAADALLGTWLVLWAIGVTENVAGYLDLGLLRLSWSSWGYVGTQLLAFALSLTNLVLRITGRHNVEWLGFALTAIPICLVPLLARLAQGVESGPVGDAADDWNNAMDWEDA